MIGVVSRRFGFRKILLYLLIALADAVAEVLRPALGVWRCHPAHHFPLVQPVNSAKFLLPRWLVWLAPDRSRRTSQKPHGRHDQSDSSEQHVSDLPVSANDLFESMRG